MSYLVKEIFYSLQGEGARSGRPAVFCRFTGCNLWSGEEKHRNKADCDFCDTDFIGTDGIGGGRFKNASELSRTLAGYWPDLGQGRPYVVFTGGEPLLQLDDALIKAMHDLGFEVAVETNGTLKAPAGIDWLCVSPKGQNTLLQNSGDELKLVFPQRDVDPEQLQQLSFGCFYLQPMDKPGDQGDEISMQLCTEYCLTHPQWQLSLQSHKLLGIR